MTLQGMADWLNDCAPKFFVARALWSSQVVVARDSIVSVSETTSPRGEKGLLILYGTPDGGECGDYLKAFLPANQAGYDG